MITRIEIDGFKSFLDFKLDVPPFLALVGPNSSGKSNLFDALEFLKAELHEGDPLLDARRGRPQELFHRVSKGDPVEEFRIRSNALITVSQDIVPVYASAVARLRDGRPSDSLGDFGVLSVSEFADYPLHLRQRLQAITEVIQRQQSETQSRSRKGFLSAGAPMSAADTWQDYVPNPEAMRGVAPFADVRALSRSGHNLAAVLGRMRETEAFGDLMIDLAALIPDVMHIIPELDEKRQEWSFDLMIDGQGRIPSTLLSDGTLRVLGLLAALHDPDHAGVLLIEEIENGLHPSRLATLLRRIRARVTDLTDPAAFDRPLRQVILTSHSPVVVSELYQSEPESLIFMDSATRVDPMHGRLSRVTVANPVRSEGEPGTYVSPRQIRRFLGTVRQGDV